METEGIGINLQSGSVPDHFGGSRKTSVSGFPFPFLSFFRACARELVDASQLPEIETWEQNIDKLHSKLNN